MSENFIPSNDDYNYLDVQAETASVRDRCQYDYRFFIALMMGEDLTMPSPDFHLTIFARMVALDVNQSVYAIPRGFAKTTIARLVVVHILTYTLVRNIFYFSHTLDLAIPSVNAIVKFLKSPNYTKVYGKVTFLVEQEGKGIYKFVMPNGKVCHLRARGANQQVRGTNVDNVRIELAICDDIEDREENNNDATYLKLKQWFYGDLKKALDRKYGKIIQIGNIVSRNSLVYEHCQSPNWYSMHYSALKSDGSPLWPELWSKEQLLADYQEYASAGLVADWFGEMMNVIIPAGSQLIGHEEILFRRRPDPSELIAGFITVDPAISDITKTAHESTIVVHGFFDDKWQIVDYFHGIALDGIKLFEQVYRLASKWGVSIVGVESEAYQAVIPSVFDYIQSREEYGHRIETLKMPTGKKSKYARISTWVGYLKSQEYCLTQGDIVSTNQLLQYDPSKSNNHDDLIDAEAYGIHMITKHLPKIMASTQKKLMKPTQPLIDICPL